MTNAEVATIWERAVADRRAKRRGKAAMRYVQMERLARRLRLHPDDERFTDDCREMLYDLDSPQLVMTEMCILDWYGDELKNAPVAEPEASALGSPAPAMATHTAPTIRCALCNDTGWVRTRPADTSSPRMTCRCRRRKESTVSL